MTAEKPSDKRRASSRLQAPVLWGMGVIMLLLIFLLDRIITQGIAVGMLYTIVILFGWFFTRSIPTIVFGIAASVLTLVDYWMSEIEQVEPFFVLSNRMLSIVVIWLIVLLVIMAKKRELAVSDLNARLEDKVFERTQNLQSKLEEISAKNSLIRESHSKLLEAMDQVRNVESKFKGILESAPDAMIIVDRAGRIELANRQVTNLFGQSEKELLGKEIEHLIPERLRASHPGHRNKFFKSPHMRPMGRGFELMGLHADGHEFPVEISLSPLKTPEGLRISAAIRDITQRKKAEEIEIRAREDRARIKELEQFAYVASHDLQEPLRVVVNFLQLLELEYGNELAPGAKEYIDTAINSSRRMKALIFGLLQYSRVGKKSISPVELRIDYLFDEVLHVLSDQIQRTGAHIRLDLNENTIHADEVQILQLFQNLLSNAIKFQKPAVPPQVDVRDLSTSDKILIAIQDNGIGIDKDQFDTVFKIFGRLNQRDQYEGHGIGLSVAARIVEHHGGKITLESEPGQGSTFIVEIPRSPGD